MYVASYMLVSCIKHDLMHILSRRGNWLKAITDSLVWSGFGQAIVSQGKNKIPFLQKASNKQKY